MHRGILHLAPAGAGEWRQGKVATGRTTSILRLACSAVSRGQPWAAVYFVIKSIKPSLSYKKGEGEEEEAWSKTVATPLTTSHQSKELLLLEKCFPAGWETRRSTQAISFYYFMSCSVALCYTMLLV